MLLSWKSLQRLHVLKPEIRVQREIMVAIPGLPDDLYRMHQCIWQHAEQASKRGVRPTFLYRVDDGLVRVRSVDFARGTVKSFRAGPCRLDLAAVIQGSDGTSRAVSADDLQAWAVSKISQAGFEVRSLQVLDYRMNHGSKLDKITGRRHRISLPVARLALDLGITDPQKALSAWEDGIGRGRRFGLGMLCH